MRWSRPVTLEGERWRLRPAGPPDAVTVTGWLADPAVHRWWGGAPVPLADVEAKYTGSRPDVAVWIVEHDGRPAGLVQAWHDPDESCGLDLFLAGWAQGRGLGPAVGRALALDLVARGWTGLCVDPAVDNLRARAAWARAGFVETGGTGEDDGHATVLMTFAPGGTMTADPDPEERT